MLAKQLLEFKNLDLKSIRQPDLHALAESLPQGELTAEYVRYLSRYRQVTDREEREAMDLLFSGAEQAKDTLLLYYLPLVVEIAMCCSIEVPCLLDRVETGNQALQDVMEKGEARTPEEVLALIHRRIFMFVLARHGISIEGSCSPEKYLEDLSYEMTEREMSILKRLCGAADFLEELLLTAMDYSVSPRRIAQVWNKAHRIIRRAQRKGLHTLEEFTGNL